MKKLLAILCTVAILFGSVFTGIVASADTADVTYYNASSIGGYTMGSSNSTDLYKPLSTATTGSYVFTVKATVGANLARFRLADSQNLGYGYYIQDNYISLRQNGGGAGIGTDLTVEGLKINNSTFKLQVKATVSDINGDGTNDTRFQIYINDQLMRTDDITSYTPTVTQVIFREIGFENPDPVLSTDTPNYYNASSLQGYTLGSSNSGDLDKPLSTSTTGSYVFTVKATVGEGLARFRLANSQSAGYGYLLQDNWVGFRYNGGGATIGQDLTVEGLKINNNTFKLQIKATVADLEGDGFDDTRMELYIDDTLVRTDDVKDFIPTVDKVIFQLIGFENVDPVLSEDAFVKLEPGDFPNYKQGTAGNIDTTIAVEKVAKNINFVAKVTTTAGTQPQFRLAGHNWNGYGYRFTDTAILFQYNNSGAITSYTIDESYVGKTFKLQMKLTMADADGDGFDDTKVDLIIDGALIGTDYVKDYTPVVGRLCAQNMAFSNNIDLNGEAATYLTPESFNYKLGTGVDGKIDAAKTSETTGNFVFTAKATLNAEGAPLFRVGGLGDWEGHDFKFNGNKIEMLKDGGGAAITTYTADESFAGKTVKVQYKALVVDRDDDGFDDTLYELYVDDVLVISKVVLDYTAKAGRIIATNMSFDKNIDISAADTMYLSPSSYNYTLGNGIDGDIDVQRVQNATGNFVFTAEATINAAGGAKFRIAGTDWVGHGYAFGSESIKFQKNGGGAAINTYPIAESYNGKTVVLKYVATVVDVDGDGLDDTLYELYIDGEKICSDYVKDFAQRTGRLCASKMSFENYVAAEDSAVNYIAPSSFPNYKGEVGADTNLTSNKTGNFVFTANATIPEGSYGNFRLANHDWEGYGYRFTNGTIKFEANGGTLIKEYNTGVNYIGTTFKLQMKLTVVDVEGDGFDDIKCELYIDNALVCSDYVTNVSQAVGKLCATNMSFTDYVAVTKERVEIDAGTLVNPGQGLTNTDLMVSLGKGVTAECISFKAVVKTGDSGVKFRFADKDYLGYGYRFENNIVKFEQNGGTLIATSATSTKGTYLNTIFKMRVEVTAMDTNFDDVNDATNYKLYIDDELLLDNTVADYNSAAATYVCVSKMAFYKENVLSGGASVSSNIADENDVKISFSHLGFITGTRYDGDGKWPYGAEYGKSILNTVFEGKVMLENGGFVRYPAHVNNMNGLELKLAGKNLVLKEVDFDANGNGETNDTLATITSADIGGAVIPVTPFDLTVHINAVCNGGEVYDDINEEPVAYIDNEAVVTYYINGYEVYSFTMTGEVSWETNDEGYLIEDSVEVIGGPSLLEDFYLIYPSKGEFLDSNSADGIKIMTPADYAGNMSYGKYTSNKTNGAWTLGLNQGFTTDVIIHEGTAVGDIIHNTIGSLKTYADGSLRFQVFIDGSGKTYRLTPEGTSYIGKQFNYKITVQDVDHDGEGLPNDIAIGIWIDGKLCNNEYIYADDVVRKMNGQNFTIFAGAELIAPEIEVAEKTYEVITPEDFGVSFGMYSNTSGKGQYLINNYKLNHPSGSINGKRFETKIKFTDVCGQGSYIAFGDTASSRLMIYPHAENNIIIRHYLGGTNNGSAVTIPGLTANKLYDLALTFDYINGNLKVGIYVDGEWVLDYWANGIGDNASLLTSFGVVASTLGKGVQFGDDTVPVLQPMEAGDYTIEYAEGTTYILNGEEIEVTEDGYVISGDELGEYTLEMVRGVYSVSKVIVIYMENDLNSDYAVDVLDFIAMMKNTMEEQFSDHVTMAAAGKTSLTDVCKPSDLVAMKKVLLGIA